MAREFQCFEQTFWRADISMSIALIIPFITLSNIKLNFLDLELDWRLFTITESLSTIQRVKLVERKVFVVVALIFDKEIFVVHVAALSSDLVIHLFCRT